MFSLDDAYEREKADALVDFAKEAARLGLIDRDRRPERYLFVVKDQMATIMDWPPTARDSMLAGMTDFLLGEPISWGDPEDGNCMKPLDPRSGWVEFKVRTEPHVRLFGAFVSEDVLIAIRARLKKEVPQDNLEQLASAWETLWGPVEAVRLDCTDPSKLVSRLDTVTP
jgi:hypothetical protein